MALKLVCDSCGVEEEQERNGNVTLYLTMDGGSQATNLGISGLIVDLCKECTKTTGTTIKERMRRQILEAIAEQPKKLFGGKHVEKGENDTL